MMTKQIADLARLTPEEAYGQDTTELEAASEAERLRVESLTPEELEAEFQAFLLTPEGEEFAYGFDVLYKQDREREL